MITQGDIDRFVDQIDAQQAALDMMVEEICRHSVDWRASWKQLYYLQAFSSRLSSLIALMAQAGFLAERQTEWPGA